MREYMERFEKVSQKVLNRYLVILLGVSPVPTVLLAIVLLLFNPSIHEALAISLLLVALTSVVSIAIALVALKRVLAATLVMVVHELSHVTRVEGEEALMLAKGRKSEQAKEVVVPEAPTRAVKPSPERAERKAPTIAVPVQKKCPFCGRTLPFGDIHTICPYCGRRLR